MIAKEIGKPQAIFNWSGGKDSSLALYYVLKKGNFNINALMTTVNSKYDRISMHGVRRELLFAQGEAIGLPIKEIRLPEMPSMEEYDGIMQATMNDLKSRHVTHSIFGDIFLEDLRSYREDQLRKIGMSAEFPLWKRDTTELVHEFIELGFKTIVVCVKSELLDASFTGRVIDYDFLKDLPSNVDPCGENGEFHTFAFDGPIFKHPIEFTVGEKVFREYKAPKDDDDACFTTDPPQEKIGFHFCDLVPI